jgi:amino acid transporter
MYSALYPVPRIIYSMASDGLIFKPFAQVLPKIKSPWIATLTTGIISGFKR